MQEDYLPTNKKINNLDEEIIAENRYDNLGQLTSKGVGGKTAQGRLQNIDYTYNVRGWLKTINNLGSIGNDLFAFEIFYNDATHSTSVDLYNGNISQVKWKSANTTASELWYIYHYDDLNRITKGQFAGNGWWDRYSLKNVSYDKNGNILSLLRKGDKNSTATAFGIMDNLAYSYQSNSNKLLKVSDSSMGNYGFKDDYTGNGTDPTNDYTYDANGNMLRDDNKGISNITYNHLNLPVRIVFASGKTILGEIEYIYDANGTKLLKKVSNYEVHSPILLTKYAGNYVYES